MSANGSVLVLATDPGPTPGVVGLRIEFGQLDNVDVLQCSHDLIDPALSMLIGVTPHDHLILAVERFVTRGRASKDQSLTRDMVGMVEAIGRRFGAPVVQRNASQVKAWATDERLKLAGIEIPTGMRHAKDAARHALYAAVHAGHLPDPYSKRSSR